MECLHKLEFKIFRIFMVHIHYIIANCICVMGYYTYTIICKLWPRPVKQIEMNVDVTCAGTTSYDWSSTRFECVSVHYI